MAKAESVERREQNQQNKGRAFRHNATAKAERRQEQIRNPAELNGGEFEGAELNGVELSRAELNGVKLSRAELNGARLSEAATALAVHGNHIKAATNRNRYAHGRAAAGRPGWSTGSTA